MTSTLQKFKDYDHMFGSAEIRACRQTWLIAKETEGIVAWVHGYTQPLQSDVQYAVYQADDHLRWQLFRVSMKGLTTVEKVAMLYKRWELKNCRVADYGKLPQDQIMRNHWMSAISIVEWVRIMNYIGALRRGGQLDMQNFIVK